MVENVISHLIVFLELMSNCPNGWLVAPGKALHSKRIVEVPCGHCSWCRKRRATEWSLRISHELVYRPYGYFVGLTYDKKSIKYYDGSIYPTLDKKDLINYMRYLRRYCKLSMKYFAVGEYGSKSDRPHYHAIILSDRIIDKNIIKENWKYGMVDIGVVEPASINYVLKYVTKSIYERNRLEKFRQNPFMICSKGIGLDYAIDNFRQINSNKRLIVKGNDVGIPRYYVKKGLLSNIDKSEIKKKIEEDRYERYVESGLEWTEFCRKERAENNMRVMNIDARKSLYKGEKL